MNKGHPHILACLAALLFTGTAESESVLHSKANPLHAVLEQVRTGDLDAARDALRAASSQKDSPQALVKRVDRLLEQQAEGAVRLVSLANADLDQAHVSWAIRRINEAVRLDRGVAQSPVFERVEAARLAVDQALLNVDACARNRDSRCLEQALLSVRRIDAVNADSLLIELSSASWYRPRLPGSRSSVADRK
ncbi:MAG: hypothetical protein V5B39_09885 [Accumulibacter sp.]|uniref:hypothetical protein n=1 Tax=Accumulibacter sp. TaxID=2053492 RepID=UPI002FC2F7B4